MDVVPAGAFETSFDLILGEETGLEDFELEGADGAEKRNGGDAFVDVISLGDTFFHELFHAGAVALNVSGVFVDDVGEALGGKAGHFVVDDVWVAGEGVSDEEVVVPDEGENVAGVGGVEGLAILAEEFLSVGETDFFSAALVDDLHVSLEDAGDDADEDGAVSVAGVHVGLDLEDEAGEVVCVWVDELVLADTASGFGGHLEEAFEHVFDAEVVHGAAEVDGHLLAGEDALEVEGFGEAVEEFDF